MPLFPRKIDRFKAPDWVEKKQSWYPNFFHERFAMVTRVMIQQATLPGEVKTPNDVMIFYGGDFNKGY